MTYTGTQSTLRTDTTTVNNLTLCNTNAPVNINLDGNSLIDERINALVQQIEEMKNMFAYCCTGTIHPYAGPAYDSVSFEILPPPPNYEWCFGQIVSKTDEKYSALYSVIGDYWNTSDSLTDDQFQLPDLRNVFLRGCPEYIDSSEENRLVGNF